MKKWNDLTVHTVILPMMDWLGSDRKVAFFQIPFSRQYRGVGILKLLGMGFAWRANRSHYCCEYFAPGIYPPRPYRAIVFFRGFGLFY